MRILVTIALGLLFGVALLAVVVACHEIVEFNQPNFVYPKGQP